MTLKEKIKNDAKELVIAALIGVGLTYGISKAVESYKPKEHVMEIIDFNDDGREDILINTGLLPGPGHENIGEWPVIFVQTKDGLYDKTYPVACDGAPFLESKTKVYAPHNISWAREEQTNKYQIRQAK